MKAELGFVVKEPDVGLFIKTFSKEIIDGAGFTKVKFRLGSEEFKKFAEIYPRFQGRTRIGVDIELTAKDKKSIDYYGILPRKDINYRLSDDFFVVDDYLQKNKSLIKSNKLERIYLHKKKKIDCVQTYILSHLYLFEDLYYEMLARSVGQEISKGVCIDKNGETISNVCFLKTQVVDSVEYINDGGRHIGEEGKESYWRGEAVISKNVRKQCKLNIFSPGEALDRFGLRSVIVTRATWENFDPELKRKLYNIPILVEGDPLQLEHQRIWKEIWDFANQNKSYKMR